MRGLIAIGPLSLLIAPPASATDVDALRECMFNCGEAASQISDPAWASQFFAMCRSNCIETYDGGYGGSSPGTGTTPINPGICNSGKCNKV